MRAMYQQFTTALDSLTRQHAELQNELAQNRQQAGNELAALRQEVRGAAQDAWRDWSAVFKGYAGAAVPRQQKLMEDAANAAAPIPNATILQVYWMRITICKGAALNIVFLAGDSEGLEAW